MSIPKFVRYIGDEVVGIEYGNIVEVLTRNIKEPSYLYVKSPVQDKYDGLGAENPTALNGKTFTLIGNWEYELIEEEKKMDNKHKFKVGDIVCGNDATRYGITNSDMIEGVVVSILPNNYGSDMAVKVIKHKTFNGDTVFPVNSAYFDLVKRTSPTSAPVSDTLYHITTDMKKFVKVEHNGNTAKAKCNTNVDEFDIHAGVDLVLERLDEVEHPEKFIKKLPKYVKYVGGPVNSGGLVKGDICKVLSGCVDESDLYVVVPNPTSFIGSCATNPENLVGYNFVLLMSDDYEIVNVYG